MGRRTPKNCDGCVECCDYCLCYFCDDKKLGGVTLNTSRTFISVPASETMPMTLRVGRTHGAWNTTDYYGDESAFATVGYACGQLWSVSTGISGYSGVYRVESTATSIRVYQAIESGPPILTVTRQYSVYEGFPAWATGVPYSIGDKVVYNGSGYICRYAHTSTSSGPNPASPFGPPFGSGGGATTYWGPTNTTETQTNTISTVDNYSFDCDGGTLAFTYDGTTTTSTVAIDPVVAALIDPPFESAAIVWSDNTCCNAVTCELAVTVSESKISYGIVGFGFDGPLIGPCVQSLSYGGISGQFVYFDDAGYPDDRSGIFGTVTVTLSDSDWSNVAAFWRYGTTQAGLTPLTEVSSTPTSKTFTLAAPHRITTSDYYLAGQMQCPGGAINNYYTTDVETIYAPTIRVVVTGPEPAGLIKYCDYTIDVSGTEINRRTISEMFPGCS